MASRLPYPYQEVVYIESTGTQYIDIGVRGYSIYGFELDFEPKNEATETGQYRAYISSTRDNFTVASYRTNDGLYLRNRTKQVYMEEGVLSQNARHILACSSNKFILDNTTLSSSVSRPLGSDTANIFLLSVNPVEETRRAKAKIFNCKIYIGSDGYLGRDFVPCYDTTDTTKHTAGLYDIVNNQFYGNSGTGYFIVGEDVYNGGRITNMRTLKSIAGIKNASGSELVKMTRVDNGKYIILGDMPTEDELYFEAAEPNSSVALTKVGNPYDVQLVYSTGDVYKLYTIGTSIKLPNIGDRLWIRAKNQNQVFCKDYDNHYKFEFTGKISANNSIQYLLDKTGQRDDVPEYGFVSLFKNQANLISPPTLPAMTLSSNCYGWLFEVTGITEPPILPAIALEESCYVGMFCASKITYPPELPATILKPDCYRMMFNDCKNFEQAPELYAEELFNRSYALLFLDGVKLNKIITHHTSWNPSDATDNWVGHVAATGDFYCPTSLPQERGINRIPTGWTIHTFDENGNEVDVIPPTPEQLEQAEMEHQAYLDLKSGAITADRYTELTGYDAPSEVDYEV